MTLNSVNMFLGIHVCASMDQKIVDDQAGLHLRISPTLRCVDIKDLLASNLISCNCNLQIYALSVLYKQYLYVVNLWNDWGEDDLTDGSHCPDK